MLTIVRHQICIERRPVKSVSSILNFARCCTTEGQVHLLKDFKLLRNPADSRNSGRRRFFMHSCAISLALSVIMTEKKAGKKDKKVSKKKVSLADSPSKYFLSSSSLACTLPLLAYTCVPGNEKSRCQPWKWLQAIDGESYPSPGV